MRTEGNEKLGLRNEKRYSHVRCEGNKNTTFTCHGFCPTTWTATERRVEAFRCLPRNTYHTKPYRTMTVP